MFNIPLKSVDDFIIYINNNGFNIDLLEKKNELQLIEFLITQSKRFLDLSDEKH